MNKIDEIIKSKGLLKENNDQLRLINKTVYNSNGNWIIVSDNLKVMKL